METHIVIMAGGIGSRFWPMSTPEYPKQFIDVLGTGRTMIQMTFDRFLPVADPANMWVVTGERYAAIVRSQLPDIPESNILLEPAARNTAPCISYACRKIRASLRARGLDEGSANIVVTPSDALVLNADEYRRVIGVALEATGSSNAIVTVGIKPTRPETGYGYIELAQGSASQGVQKVQQFREKPCLEVAEGYFKSGRHLWNAGIFVWNSATIGTALRMYAPQIEQVMDQLEAHFGAPDEQQATAQLFPTCEKISIDYAVMEKSPDIYTIPGDFGWSDLGTWGSVLQNCDKDAQGNAVVGKGVSLFDCSGTVVHVSDLQTVVVQGLDGYIVAEKDGRLLICALGEEQRIKDFH